jgi:hypothetical protein
VTAALDSPNTALYDKPRGRRRFLGFAGGNPCRYPPCGKTVGSSRNRRKHEIGAYETRSGS